MEELDIVRNMALSKIKSINQEILQLDFIHDELTIKTLYKQVRKIARVYKNAKLCYNTQCEV